MNNKAQAPDSQIYTKLIDKNTIDRQREILDRLESLETQIRDLADRVKALESA